MSENNYWVRFLNSHFPSLMVSAHQPLSEVLTVQNSPVLFGCRTGICGTCLVQVEGDISPPDEDEQEILEAIAPELPHARLACQIDLTSDITIQQVNQ